MTTDINSDNRVMLVVPRRFYDDHSDRGCVQFTDDPIVKRTATTCTVRLDPRDVADLLNDAVYYSDGSDLWGDYRALVASAKATVVRLVEQGVEPSDADRYEVARIIAKDAAAKARRAARKAAR